MSLKDIIITASINSIPTQSYGQKTYIASSDEQSFPIETIDGGNGGSMPNLFGQTSSIDLFVNITQSWPGSIDTPVGLVSFIHDDQSEFIDGEFSGSVLTVTTQSLNPECWPILFGNQPNISYGLIPYKSEYSDGVLQDGGPFSIFIDRYTAPNPGHFLIHSKINWISDIDTYYLNINYLKVAKVDQEGNDNTLSLQELKNVRWTDSNPDIGEIILTVKNITEYSSYYLYEVTSKTWEKYLTPPSLSSVNILNYALSASSNITGVTAASVYYIPYNTWTTGSSTVDFDGIYYRLNESTPFYLHYTASIQAKATGFSPISFDYGIYSTSDSVSYNKIASLVCSAGPITYLNFILTGSFLVTEKPYFYWTEISNLSNNILVQNVKWIVTQSFAPQSATSSIVVEPYLTATFANSDCDVLMNNVELNEYDKQFMKVNYDSGQLVPTNQQQIISGTAEPAPVKAYNYRILSQTLPRYSGVKTTSPNLNLKTITTNDSLATGYSNVNSEKVYVAYCETIEDYSPQRMTTSDAQVKYLIFRDGSISIPNTSQNSLTNLQHTFLNGERLEINCSIPGLGDVKSIKDIVRGGYRLEPILYTQSGSIPNAKWANEINLTDIIPAPNGAINNVSAIYNNSTPYYLYITYTETPFDTLLLTGGISPTAPGRYKVNMDVIDDGIDLYFKGIFNLKNVSPNYDYIDISIKCLRDRGGNITQIGNIETHSTPPDGNFYNYYWPDFGQGYAGYNIPNADLKVDDEFYFEVIANDPNPGGGGIANLVVDESQTQFGVDQYPIYTSPIAVGNNSIWGFPDYTNYPNVITSSNETLCNLYGNSNVKQADITASQFNPITLPWSIKVGDEFRFEGREDRVYNVIRNYGPFETDSNRITPIGPIEVQFNQIVPSASNAAIFDKDHFLIRRYVDDASLILFNGFKPTNSSGPYILKPEYVVPELDKDIGAFITDLTSKGLL